ncbi:MAG: hypothetical protein LBD85_04050, partial [Oscillospiraceae bacterium]|nr:hypothetical protein [Oscillospiraceae bacterium]
MKNPMKKPNLKRSLPRLALALLLCASLAVPALSFVLATPVWAATDITDSFTDPNFRAAVYEKIGKTAPAPILDSDVNGITKLNVESGEIKSLAGIEHFTALTQLYCKGNQLTALDVSKNTALTSLLCDSNQLTALDVSENTALTSLWCIGNQLAALDVSKNTALTDLNCGSNLLTALDVSNNAALTSLVCSGNQLAVLDVSNNVELTSLNCGDDQLTVLDVSKNTALKVLYCNNNQLTALDVSRNTALTNFNCAGNQLPALDVSTNIALIWLVCDSNQLTVLDVSKNTALTGLVCYGNQLTALDVSKNTALKNLDCHGNYMPDVSAVAGYANPPTTDFTFEPQNDPSAAAAKPTASAVLVDGESVVFDAYNIGDNNYFKLRDLAYTLNGSPKQFEVGWDGANNAIALTSGKAYTSAGGEMEGKGAGDKTATPTTSKITLDGKEVSLTAYNIGGNNYFKLRDIGAAFDFGVDWDGA